MVPAPKLRGIFAKRRFEGGLDVIGLLFHGHLQFWLDFENNIHDGRLMYFILCIHGVFPCCLVPLETVLSLKEFEGQAVQKSASSTMR
jgi:hypothetical protein